MTDDPMTPAAKASVASSCAKHPLDCVARHGVEEERKNSCQEDEEDGFENDPLVVVPKDVADRLQWVQEPDEGGVRAAVIKHTESAKGGVRAAVIKHTESAKGGISMAVSTQIIGKRRSQGSCNQILNEIMKESGQL